MRRFNRQEGGEPYPDRIIAAESAERRYGCAGHSDYSVLSTNSELLPLAYSGRAADEQQAQDAAQETFLKAVRWLDSCGGFQGAFRPFLYKIAKNICIDLNRTMERSEISLESLPGEPAYQESGFAAAEEKANLRALTAQLEPEQRELVLLRFAQQLKLREIAQITGLPLRTVQSRLRAALKTLKMQLEKEDWR